MTVGTGRIGCLDIFALRNKICRAGFEQKVVARVGEFVQAHFVILFRGFIISA